MNTFKRFKEYAYDDEGEEDEETIRRQTNIKRVF